MRKTLLLILFLFIFSSISIYAQPIVALITDFGLQNDAVGLCHGAILAVNPNIQIVDLCNNIKPYDIKQAGFTLRRSTVFPVNTVFVCVVDPGVGTTRNSIAIKTKKGLYYIAPNNGLLSFVIEQQGIEEVYELEPMKINPNWVRGTFDGRDLYSPAGAILASNNGNLSLIGKPLEKEKVVRLLFSQAIVYEKEGEIDGYYIQTDEPYGNVWTNITIEDLNKVGIKLNDKLLVKFSHETQIIPFVLSFGDVPKGCLLAYINSAGTLSFAINQDNFSKKFNIKEDESFIIRKYK